MTKPKDNQKNIQETGEGKEPSSDGKGRELLLLDDLDTPNRVKER